VLKGPNIINFFEKKLKPAQKPAQSRTKKA